MKRPLLFAALALLAAGFASSLAARAEKSFTGQPMPKFRLDYLEKNQDLAGKPYILEFWATWCGPCKQSIPHMNELYAKYKDKGLVIVGVTDEDKGTVKDFLKGTPINYPVAFDKGGKLNETLAITGIPHAMIVGKDGKVVWEGHPLQIDEKVIEQILQ
jgi:thiol-disulfide isomerase/thioredoxin